MYKASRGFCLAVFLFSLAFAAAPAQGGAPDIVCPNDMSVHNGGNVSSNYSVTDPENDFITLTYRIDPPGPWLTNVVLHPSSGYAPFSGYVTFDSHCPYPGVYKIWIKAYDGTYYDSCYFQVTVYNNPPQINCPANASVHAGDHFTSTNVVLQDPDGDGMSWVYLYTTPTPVNQPYKQVMHVEWNTTCEDLFNGPVFTMFLEVTDDCGKKDTCSFEITVTDQPPQITCPNDTSVHAGNTLISSNFFAYDIDDPTGVTVNLQSVSPTPTNMPTIVGNHVEWNTTCEDLAIGPIFTFTLVATDPCGLKDTCDFTVNVYNQPPQLNCPNNGSVHGGQTLVSTNFSVTDPEGDPTTVAVLDINPGATNTPTIVGSHVEWVTTCNEVGKTYTIRLVATDSCGAKDTCDFTVNVYNQPPQLTCPNNGNVHAGQTFVSTNFSVTDPEGDPTTVAFLDINPGATNTPTIVGSHVEWVTTCNEAGKIYTIRLVATDSCGAKDTCEFTVNVYNQPPVLTCPDNGSVHAGTKFVSTNFSYTDPDDPTGVIVAIIRTDPGPSRAPDLMNNHVEWLTSCNDLVNGPVFTITLVATDSCGAKDTCSFEVTVTNYPPSCQLFCPQQVYQGVSVNINFTVSEPEGDFIKSVIPSVDFGSVGPATPNSGYPPLNGSFIFTAPDDPFTGFVHITLTVTDSCGAHSVCECSVEVIQVGANQVKIPNTVYERFGYGHWIEGQDSILVDDFCYPFQGINPGGFFEIPIILKNFENEVIIGAFELEVDFDYIDLTFYGAERGILLTHRESVEDTLYTWEYFSYRVLPCPTCACCKYRILLYGQAEMPDGLFRRGYCLNPTNDFPETYWAIDYAKYYHNGQMQIVNIGATLVWLKFQVANNELLRDLKLPIVFEWEHKLGGQFPNYYIIQDWDCAENTMSSCDGVDLYVSKNHMQYEPAVCGLSQPGGGDIFPILDFVDGGVHICSPCTSFKCVRGDINLNHVAYEPADAVLLARALIFGAPVVFWNIDEQTCATDINADGRTLMLSDLIYLIRVIQDDAVPFGKLGPSSDVANLIISDGRITVECASAIGGLLVTFDGVVTPTLLNNNMEMIANESKALVWSSKGNSINAGASEVLTFAGAKPVLVIAVDREGRELATTITTKVAPSSFALNAAYPNPFNPYTNLSFTLPNAMAYNLKIYNVAGQLVRSYEGMGTAGLNVMTWDGKDNAGNEVSSGVYFYKLIADQHSAIKKMIMLK